MKRSELVKFIDIICYGIPVAQIEEFEALAEAGFTGPQEDWHESLEEDE